MRVDIKTTLCDSWVVNDRYEIYQADGVVYDTEQAQDIPQYIFQIRDTLMSIVDLNN
jgi:hypothetical protein